MKKLPPSRSFAAEERRHNKVIKTGGRGLSRDCHTPADTNLHKQIIFSALLTLRECGGGKVGWGEKKIGKSLRTLSSGGAGRPGNASADIKGERFTCRGKFKFSTD